MIAGKILSSPHNRADISVTAIDTRAGVWLHKRTVSFEGKFAAISLVLISVVSCSSTSQQPPTPQMSAKSAAESLVGGDTAVERPEELASPKEYFESEIFSRHWPSEGFGREELVSTALAKAFLSFEAKTGDYDSTRLAVVIDPAIPPENTKWITSLAEATILTWSKDIPAPLTLVVGTSNEFLVKAVRENNLTMPEISPGNTCHYDYGACTSVDTIWVGWGGQPLNTLRENRGVSRMLSHKAFHAIQNALDLSAAGQAPPRNMANFRPVWFVEGSAEFYGYAINDFVGLHSYGQSQLLIPFTTLREFEEWKGLGLRHDNRGPYFWGQVAIEYLVANTGFDGYEEIYRSLERGNSFEQAFLDGAGISLDEFYENFDQWALSYSGD